MNEIKHEEYSQARPLARTLAREMTADEVGLVSGVKTGPDPIDYPYDPNWPGAGSDAEMK